MDTAVKVELLTGLQVHDLHFTLTAQTHFTALLRRVFPRSARRHDSADAPFHPPRQHRVRPEVPELARLFAFWLAALTWRRASNNTP